MSAYPSGGGTVANPPLYPDYVNATTFIVNGNSASLSPFSGPKGSPFDALMYPSNIAQPVPSQRVANTADHSTGALSTGIGFESTDNGAAGGAGPNGSYGKAGLATAGLIQADSGVSKGIPTGGPGALNGFTDDYTPGVSTPGLGTATDARFTAIGGGRCNAPTVATNGIAVPNPYNAQPICDMGVGGSRDAGAGPVFTGFFMKTVTASADVAQGAAIETGFTNRTAPAASGVVLKSGTSAFGSSTAASAAIS